MEETINIPIKATYRISGDSFTKIDEIRADVPVDAIAKIFAEHFGLDKAVNS